jgi:DNA-binding response OmpR family regulator
MAHILLLEPDSLIAGSISRYFANANHSVAVHSDPQQAVISADRQLPDAVITELQLAGRSGAEFLYEFRSYPDWQSIPVIVFTNLPPDQAKTYEEALAQLNVTACLRKSGTGLDELLRQAEQALSYEKV